MGYRLGLSLLADIVRMGRRRFVSTLYLCVNEND